MVVLGLQLFGDGDHGQHALFVGEDVGLDGLVLLGRRLHRGQVETEVVLRMGTRGEMAEFKRGEAYRRLCDLEDAVT